MKNLILFATYQEAEHTIAKLEAKKITPTLYAVRFGYLAIVGMGGKNLFNFESIVERCDVILNFGIAGALKSSLCDNTLYPIKSVFRGSERIDLVSSKGCTLYTLDTPLHAPKTRDALACYFDLVDMEGFEIATLAKKKQKPCLLYKIISDRCNQTTSEEIHRNIGALSLRLSSFVTQTIREGKSRKSPLLAI
jgi:nucleoside phosphorylase